ncbi:MAG: type 2 lantipeptide synthetase LanM family protein [Scytonematopsis contorta HA4267-MV1]|jgi:type 2 lantibiotic biosynthesis protein LanM|nr:type 2 lantipeptide synthetase LanM family protein [Scytonematopsis contorta HA4267-MV1]
MEIYSEYLKKIVEKSSSIAERLGDNFILKNTPIKNDQYNPRIKNWCNTVADGRQDIFEKRLAWDGLNLNNISHIFEFTYIADEKNLPDWTKTLKLILEKTALIDAQALENDIVQDISQRDSVLNSQETLPFEELFLPFIIVAREKLNSQVIDKFFLLDDNCYLSFERSLLKSLTSLFSQTLALKFQMFRLYEQPSLISGIAQLKKSYSREYYSKFISKMLSGGLLLFLQEYSVLARLAATTIDFWVNNTCEFIQRLASDWLDIQKTFQDNVELEKVVEIKLGLSDLHQEGRSVIELTFDSGLKLIYKPKSLGLEVAYFELLNWLNDKDVPHQLKVLKIINRSNYGWVEYVEHLPLKDKQAAVRYYQRAGMLLCLLYILSGTDFHDENVIASGEQPVLIDMEMLMSGRVRKEGSSDINADASYLVSEQFSYSVLNTYFLPKWELGSDGLAYDVSGLSGNEGQATHFRAQKWQHMNTDDMTLGYEYIKTGASSNLPVLDGVHLSASDYVQELVDGFREMYQFFLINRDEFLTASSSLASSPLARLAHQRVRTIFRPSQVYASLLKQTQQPKYLRDGIERSIAFDVLCKPLLKYENKPHWWEIIAVEQQALQQLDIPLFSSYSDSYDLKINSHQTIQKYFIEPSYDFVTSRLSQLNKDDLELQIGLIRSSLYSRIISKDESVSSQSKQPVLNIDAISPLSKEILVQQSLEIAQELQKRSVRATDGSVCWMGMEYIPETGRLQPSAMSYDFYDGSSGVALFLAALAKVTNSRWLHDLALDALKPTRSLLQNLDSLREREIIKKIGIGGGKGFGSIIYTLVKSSLFLKEPILLEDARQVASLITEKTITNDDKYDIISGTSGTILGLLALYQATSNSDILELAKNCGYHLLNHRVNSNSGYLTWATVGGKCLTGLSHGAAGIAYALLRLYAVACDPVFLEAAEEAIAYERSVFSPKVQNWPDLRSEKPMFGMSWCHGAPGIALARLGCLPILDTSEIRQEIETALQTMQKYALQEIDHLCCGNFGRIDVLLVAAQNLCIPELLETAQKQAAYCVQKAENNGYFQISVGNFKGIYNPAFFQGTAGIGYELLRLAYPDLLPSVLLWE